MSLSDVDEMEESNSEPKNKKRGLIHDYMGNTLFSSTGLSKSCHETSVVTLGLHLNSFLSSPLIEYHIGNFHAPKLQFLCKAPRVK